MKYNCSRTGSSFSEELRLLTSATYVVVVVFDLACILVSVDLLCTKTLICKHRNST